MICFRSLLLTAALCSATLSIAVAVETEAPSAEAIEHFEKHVRPLLAEACFSCHGAKKEESGLRLDSRASILAGGENGPAIVLGKPDESLLIKAVRRIGDYPMPPEDKLSDVQVAVLAKWVDMGAPWPGDEPSIVQPRGAITEEQRRHWSFQPVGKHEPPTVQDTAWPKSPIDHFVLAKLEQQGLHPAPAADNRMLLRRVTFDLTGLPPTVAEIDAFLKDESPEAYRHVVDRLLESPAYGQRWARHWLDLVRYTDSFDSRILGGNTGMDCDEAYKYRDWVVDALNADLPCDQFIADQIAGDVLHADAPPQERRSGIIATGMLAIGNWGGGDSDKEKLLTDIADDQVDVVSRTFMGLTVACARCHDHKFDPIPTQDYYSLAGIFFSTHILQDVGPKTNGPPMLKISLETPSDAANREAAKQRIAKLEADKAALQAAAVAHLLPATADYLAALEDGGDVQQVAQQRHLNAAVLSRWRTYFQRAPRELLSQADRNVQGQASLVGWSSSAMAPTVTANTSDQPLVFTTITMPARSIAVHPSPSSGAAITWRSPLAGRVRVSGRIADIDNKCGNGVAWRLEGDRGVIAQGAIANGGSAESPATETVVTTGDAISVIVLPSGEYSCDSTLVELSIAELDGQQRTWSLTADLITDLIAANPHADSFGNDGVWRFEEVKDAESSPALVAESLLAEWSLASGEKKPALAIELTASLVQASNLAAGQSAPIGVAALLTDLRNPQSKFWNGQFAEILSADAATAIKVLDAELAIARKIAEAPPELAVGAQEGGVPGSPQAGVHDVRVHQRGRYDRLAEDAPRRFPRILAGDNQPNIAAGSGRRELAAWLVSPNHPLTARVLVNRLWQQHFGNGLVRTPDNFGKLGQAPSHPELLDYLARSFMESGWSLKAAHRQMLLSATYQQSSSPSEQTLAVDPENILLGRMNRRRLEAESLRDSLLAVAGKLDSSAGGPALRDLNNNRRTIYLMTVRSDRSTFRELFDAADPTAVIARRNESTVAPQSLFMLNHPFVISQAQSLAERTQQIAAPRERIGQIYEALFGRSPTAEEADLGMLLVADNDWPGYCHTLLCSNEFVYID